MSDLFGDTPTKIVPRDLLAVYDAEFRRRFHTAAPIVGKKDAPLAARLLRMYSFDELSSWVRLYFDVPDKFIQQGGFTFGIFSACIAKVIAHDRRLASRIVVHREAPSQNLIELRKQLDAEWRSHSASIPRSNRRPRVPSAAAWTSRHRGMGGAQGCGSPPVETAASGCAPESSSRLSHGSTTPCC